MDIFKWFFNNKEYKSVGEKGEDVATRYLKQKGYKILEKNFKNDAGRRLGEIDIIAEKEGCIVFVEVKTRMEMLGDNPLPEENITPSKLYKLNKIAQYYIKIRDSLNTPYQFDAVSVQIDQDSGRIKIKHIEHIFF